MDIKNNFTEAVTKLREENKKERKFDQTVDIIVNLKDFDVRKNSFNIFIGLPNKIKDKKIFGFFEKENKAFEGINKDQFIRYKEKRDVKKLVKSYDFFIANAKLMPAVATNFGRILGPAGKMPSPQLGIISNEEEDLIKTLIDKINKSVRVIVKQPSIKIGAAKLSLENDKIAENLVAVYTKILENLPKGIDNIRNVKIKLTMSKTVAVKIK
jgi:large subunit ribosomal protein L1